MENAHTLLQQILFGGSIEDKLAGAGLKNSELDWKECQALDAPIEAPGRTGLLKARTIAGAHFPKKSELGDASARGRLLHYFANHELLAIETMAYVLLRFPDADPAFRQGVFRTLQDEQRHLQQYLVRMRELSVNLGDVPLNLYFWNSLKNMRGPLDYVTQMSLTFEQANLDFALFFTNFFETEVQDPVTAKLLKEVHDDEIKHVAHGLKWFNQWRDPADASEYDSYLKLLPFPMTPRRAKGGHLFSEQSRRDAGMSEDFIRSIQVAGGSRGKVPNLYYFNPQCEVEKELPTLNQQMRTKIMDLAPLMLWLAGEEDVVELDSRPDLNWLTQVHQLKGELPELLTPNLSLERYQAFDEFKPWGFSESAWKKLGTIKSKLRKPPQFEMGLHREKLFSKRYWKEVLGEDLSEAGSEEVLIKADQSTSGRGHQRIPRALLSDSNFNTKLEKRRSSGDRFIIEPFYNKLHDFSVNYELTAEGRLIEFDSRFFKVDSQFQYLGSFLGKHHPDPAYRLSAELLEREKPNWKSEHGKVIQHLRDLKYVGAFGIDALIYHDKDQRLKIAPVIEVNVRTTMGRVALEIEKVLIKKHSRLEGFWMFLHHRDLLGLGCRNFKELEAKLTEELGVRFVATTPSSAQLTWTFAILDHSLMERFFKSC